MVQLRHLMPYSPSELLSGTLGEWITIILISVLFIAIAGAALPKRLTESKTGKSLLVTLGLFLGVALYQVKDTLHFNLESFGFVAFGLLIIIAFIVTYGVTKLGLQNKRLAFAISYSIIYLTFALITPSLLDTFAASIPILNGILALLFIVSLGYAIIAGFKAVLGSGSLSSMKNLGKLERQELREEEKEEKEEIGEIKHHAMKLSKEGLHDLDEIHALLHKIAVSLRDPNLSQDAMQYIGSTLNKIAQLKDDLQHRLLSLRQYTQSFKQNDTQRLNTLRSRLQSAKSDKQRKEIETEIEAEKKKLELMEFMTRNDSTIMRKLMDFQKHMHYAVQSLRQHNRPESINHIKAASEQMGTMKHLLKQLIAYEKHVKSLDKKERSLQRKEEAGK